MDRAVVEITLFGLLLAFGTTLPNKGDWDIYSFHINSTVSSRYATTVITSRVANRMDESKEIEFQVRIPKNAFISKFRMLIDGQMYDGVVKAKEQAQQQYSEAVSRGQSAGLVSSVGRTLEEFKTSVTVAAHQKVTFELTYEELLKRRLGKYELQIHARPMQPVKDFKVDVYIHENAGLSLLEVKGGLSTKVLADAITKTHSDKQAWVYFYPTEDQQKTCDSCGEEGMNGDLVIVYDVNRDASIGDIETSDGYFVHHFAPSGLFRIPKNFVFVIDKSGSMQGKKIEQTRTALIRILNDLAEDDYFGLITFDSRINRWKQELVQANKENVDNAKNFAQHITHGGSTDINGAVLQGAQMLNAHPREGSASILILLTDGDPTSGVTNLKQIHLNVRGAIAEKFPLYCLGFGFDVNFEFLETMSLQNSGAARRIYQDSDADLQLTGFYEEVATPLLTDVTMIYTGGINLTQTNFSQYYNGSEIVVAGQILDNDVDAFIPQVVAISSKRRLTFSETSKTVESTETASERRIQRVWAYLTVKQLLDKQLQLSGAAEKKVRKEALELSLKYSFVTPLTSIVVTKPPGENTEVLHKPKEGQQQGTIQHNLQLQRQPNTGFSAGRSVFRSFSGQVKVDSIPVLAGSRMRGRRPQYSPTGMRPSSPQHFDRGYALGIPGSMPDLDIPALERPAYDTNAAPQLSDDYPPVLHSSIPQHFDHVPALIVPTLNIPAPSLHRFLIKTENQSLPLCFDIKGDVRLKLLHHPSGELIVNGKLQKQNEGFKRIVIHLNSTTSIEVETSRITVKDEGGERHYIGINLFTVGSVTVIMRDKEIDVTAGDTRMVILLHEKNRRKFLWPVLRLKPSASNAEGILALNPAIYEEVQQSPSTKLKIKDQEIDVTRSDAVDYSIVTVPTLRCYLMSAESALQRPLDDFIVTAL